MSHNAIALNKRGFPPTHSIVSRAPLPLFALVSKPMSENPSFGLHKLLQIGVQDALHESDKVA
jgi:hypothetical protein